MIDRREFLIVGSATATAAAAGLDRLKAKNAPVRVLDLRTDHIDQPLGLENPNPRLSWRLESEQRNVSQSAYRVRVATSRARLAAGRPDLWDSGRIRSRKSIGIRYAGRRLTSRQRCWWQVEVWDAQNHTFRSQVSHWEMGLLEPTDWKAEWLAVEDAVARADRECGLHWMWGDETESKTQRGFRLRFALPTAVTEGELFVVANDWPIFTQITRVWLDGLAIAGSGEWVTDADQIGITESSHVRCSIPKLSAGEHVVAIQVETAGRPDWGEDINLQYFHLTHGIAGLIRLRLETGEVRRIPTGPEWVTAQIERSDWVAPGFDDRSWPAANSVPLQSQPWPAAPAMWLRKRFVTTKPITRARLYVSALGAYEARLNGQRVGDALLTPEPSYYAKHILYRVHDVTSLIRSGDNVLGLTVGDGWYASFDDRYAFGPPPRRVIARLEVSLRDGTQESIVTGPGWRLSDSSICESQIRIGEIQDARLEKPGWDLSGFDDSGWDEARVAVQPSGRLVAQVTPPIRALRYLNPRSVTEPKPGLYVFDFGENFSGWCRLRVAGSRGTRIELAHAELLTSAGEVNQPYGNIGKPKNDVYILKGDVAGETFEPHFTFRGFRYVQISGLPAPPTTDALTGVSIHTDLKKTGVIRSDSALIEDIWRATVRTHDSNLIGLPIDTPGREQRPFAEVSEIIWDGASFDADLSAFSVRVMDTYVDNQSPDGCFPRRLLTPLYNTAFEKTEGSTGGHGEAAIVIPWTAWRHYGDTAIINRYWTAMNRHVQFILDNNPDFVWRHKRGHDEGDWLALDVTDSDRSLPHTPKDLLSTAFWGYSLDLLAQMGDACGRTLEAAQLRETWTKVKAAFAESFVKGDGTLGNGSQTSYILALRFGLVPEALRQAAADRLAENIRSRGIGLTTGIFGTQFVLDVLAANGHASLAYDILLKTDYPSWGHMIRSGASTIWETWSGSFKSSDGKVLGQLCRNHPDLASAAGFLFRHFAGIDALTPGFEEITIRPVPNQRLGRGGGDYDSIMGRISTDWARNADGSFSLEVSIPANTTAHIHLPGGRGAVIKESGTDAALRDDMRIIERRDEETVIEVGSGTYRFIVS